MRMEILLEGIKMSANSFIKWIIISHILLVTASCTIGNWNICGPQTPRANCDREASEKLLHPTPLSDEWEKEGVNHEDRRQDWIACGGNKTGWYDVPTKATGLEYNAESALAHHKIQRCMLGKGYRYTGPCHGNEITNAWPACGAP